jgi:hypothetical protein
VSYVLSAPLWLVALAFAAAAPFCVGALQSVLELRLRRRTEEAIARALSTHDHPDANRRGVSARAESVLGEEVDSEVRLLAAVKAAPAADEIDPREEG